MDSSRRATRTSAELLTARPPAASLAIGASARRRTVTASSSRRTATTSALLATIGSLQHLVAIHNLLNLLKTTWAECRCNQRHRGRALGVVQVFHRKTSPWHNRDREIRPPFPLLLVVVREQHFLPLLRVQARDERVRGVHDSDSLRLRHRGANGK